MQFPRIKLEVVVFCFHLFFFHWLVLSDEQMSQGWQSSLLNDEQMSNWLGVEHQPVIHEILFHDFLFLFK